jgi:hypothetical protein
MRIEQLQLFQEKGAFNSSSFEAPSNIPVFKKIAESVTDAFNIFSSHDITDFDSTTRSNMLNNLVVKRVQRNCESDRFKFHATLMNTRRSLAILDEQYILFFKKSPVSNLKTDQDDLIKNQEFDKHIIFVVYSIDEFWGSLSKLEFQYFSSPRNVSYTYDISNYLEQGKSASIKVTGDNEVVPAVTIKKDISKTRKAQ